MKRLLRPLSTQISVGIKGRGGASSPVGQASFSSQSQASGPSQFQKGTASPWYLMKKGVYIAAQVAILSVFRGRGSPL